MPHIRFRSVKNEHVQQLSGVLVKELAQAMNTSEDNFTVESIATQFFQNGKEINSYPFVEVLCFPRPQEVQDVSARIITEKVKGLTQAEDVIVVFNLLSKTAYYENGTHF